MAFDSRVIGVDTTAAEIEIVALANRSGGEAILRNVGTATIYLGGPEVSTGTGFPLYEGESLPVSANVPDTLYAICETTGSLAVIEKG